MIAATLILVAAAGFAIWRSRLRYIKGKEDWWVALVIWVPLAFGWTQLRPDSEWILTVVMGALLAILVHGTVDAIRRAIVLTEDWRNASPSP